MENGRFRIKSFFKQIRVIFLKNSIGLNPGLFFLTTKHTKYTKKAVTKM